VNTCRHQRFRQFPAQHQAISGALDRPGIDDGSRELLDEEWHAVGSFHDLADNPARHETGAGDGCYHLLAFARCQFLQSNPLNCGAR
jgi:hypothetical protein